MSWYHSFFRTVGIIALASAIVAIGAQELYQDQARRGKSRGADESRRLLQELRGGDLRARMSPETPEIERQAREIRERNKAAAKPAPQKRLDRLDPEDKSALDRWIDGLSR